MGIERQRDPMRGVRKTGLAAKRQTSQAQTADRSRAKRHDQVKDMSRSV